MAAALLLVSALALGVDVESTDPEFGSRNANAVDDSTDRWTVGDNQIHVERRGNDVLLLDAPHAFEHDAVEKALWEKTWTREIQNMDDIDAAILTNPAAPND